MYSKEEILLALGKVIDPDLNKDLVSLNMIQDLEVEGEEAVKFKLILTTPACPLKDKLINDCTEAIHKFVDANLSVDIELGSQVTSSRSQDALLPGVRNIVAVASGKGGVGKSTISVNLAVALAQQGASVGLLDADIYGPSVPKMMGLEGQRPKLNEVDGKRKLLPIERHGIKTLSIGYLLEEGQAVVWRGPMVSGAIKQLVADADWGDLDYLIVDLPPGTGDAQLTLVQSVPVTGVLMVTTPQQVAVADARKAMDMFSMDTISVPLLGVVENMSYFCPKELPDKQYFLFGKGGGEKLAKEAGIELLAQLPIEEQVMEGSEKGEPTGIDPTSEFAELAGAVARQVAIRNNAAVPTETVKITT